MKQEIIAMESVKKAALPFLISLLCANMVACGGAMEETAMADDDQSMVDQPTTDEPNTDDPMTDEPADDTSGEPVAEPNTPDTSLKTTDLDVPEGTDFIDATHYDVHVSVDKSAVYTGKAFISICSDYDMLNSVQIRANYENCQVRASFEGGVFEKTVSLDHTDHELAVSVIFLEDGQKPYVEMFSGLSPNNNRVFMD